MKLRHDGTEQIEYFTDEDKPEMHFRRIDGRWQWEDDWNDWNECSPLTAERLEQEYQAQQTIRDREQGEP